VEQSNCNSMGSGCRRAFVAPIPALVPTKNDSLTKSLLFEMPVTLDCHQCYGWSTEAFRSYQEHNRPPPIDLLVTLQHYLI
jgi:hypothetical protein